MPYVARTFLSPTLLQGVGQRQAGLLHFGRKGTTKKRNAKPKDKKSGVQRMIARHLFERTLVTGLCEES